MSDHEHSQRMVEGLRIGNRIHVKSGAGNVTLVALGPIQPADPGSYAGRQVLHTTGDAFFPFSTHLLYYQDDGRLQGWMMSGGQSYQNLTEAVESFNQYEGVTA